MNEAGFNLKPGDRVKLTKRAFDQGVQARNAATLKYVGTVVRRMRDPSMIVVRWDHKKTPDHLFQAFLMKATTDAAR